MRCNTSISPNTKKHVKKQKKLSPHNNLISWYKDDTQIKIHNEQDKNNNVEKPTIEIRNKLLDDHLVSELIINNADSKNSGLYSCIYENVREEALVTVTDQS